MTVHFEVPIIRYIANGVTTDFAFNWSSGNPEDNYVTQDGTLLTEGVLYELEEYNGLYGGIMRFNDPPASGTEIVVYRETPITQEVDYVDFEAFPADTHEDQMDKDTRILQEMIFGGRALGGVVDLDAVQYPEYVEITNTAGQNAILEPWTTNGLLAGVALGEVIDYGDTIPTDGTPTSKHDGYIWWCLGPLPQVGGDTNIAMATTPLTYSKSAASPTVPVAEFRYDATTGNIQYGNVTDGFTDLDGITTPPTGLTEYWIKFEVTSGTAIERTASTVDTWLDAYDVVGDPDEFYGWYVQDPGVSQTVSGIFTIAPDDGGGSPDEGQAISRYVTLTASQT